jgi:hypothetical protein
MAGNFIVEGFHAGGWGMFPTAVFGVLMVGASVRYAISPDKRLVPLQVSLGVLTFVSGLLGFVTGLIKTCSAIAGVPNDQKWIALLGLGESLNNVGEALMLMAFAAIAACIGAYRISRNASLVRQTA